LRPSRDVVDDPAMPGLLAGMRVLDLSVWRPMPHATQILADLGADVLKLEPPGGDPMRGYPEIFASVARGKRSIELDLRTDAGLARALELAAEADVVCEAWRPGVADRLGVGYDAVRVRRPDTIYCSLSGYGAEGPMRDVPGHDVNFQALAGALAPRDGVASVPRLPVADLEGGTVCALLVCAAWSHRLTTGAGERIDVAMTDVVAWWVGTTSGVVHDAAEERTAGSPGYGVFRTRDDRWLALGVLAEARLWDAIVMALGLDDLLGLDFAARLAMTATVNERIAAAIAALDLDDAVARLEASGAPVSAVLTPEEATGHAQLHAREIHVQTAAGTVVGLPARLAGRHTAVASELPAVGAHPEGFTPR
jgi:crotonobetainyl-CoA:carnitine CoA-transferase CaiB-like acyl-CoA transferase